MEKLTPQIGEEKHSLKDMQLEDVTSSETRYLPINSELTMSPLKPLHLGTSPTALPQDSPTAGTHPKDVPERDTSSSSVPPSSGDSQHQQESRYLQYENRPIKPLNQNRRIAANFAFSPKMQGIKPQPSNSRPQPHCSRWSEREPVSTEVTLNDSSNGSSSVSSSNVTSELKLLKDILQSKRAKLSGVRRSHSAHVHSDANKEQIRSSVSSSLYKSEYSPDKYMSGRRSTRSRGSGGSREYGVERRRDSGSGSSRKVRDDTDGVVQSLQTWKSDVLCSREELVNHKHLAEEAKSSQSTTETPTALESRNSHLCQQSAQGRQQSSQLSVDASQQVHLSLKESELETTCQSLQKQEVLTSISNYVFQGGVISADQDDTGASCDIRLSIDTEDHLHVAHPGSSRCSLSPSSPTSTPAPGIPTPPENLRIFQRTATSGVLQWEASVIHSSSGKLSNKPIIGYRVYANGCAKGMVAGTQMKALVEGLSSTNTYRLTVRAVAALGDSADSNIVIVHAEGEEGRDTPKSPPPPPDDDNDSPDTQRGKHPDTNNGGSPPGGSPPGGDTEPPGGSAEGSRRSSRGSNAGSGTHEDGTTCLHSSSGSLDMLECQSSPPGAPHTSTPISRTQAELGCDVDSGCWTSPMSSEKRQQVSPVFVPQHKDERRSRVSQSPDRQQRHLETKQKITMDDQKSTLGLDDERGGSVALLSSSPRIQEALIKRLEVGRDKGMLVEMKMAAKMHKRKTGPDVSLPLKAVRNSADGDSKSVDKSDITMYVDAMVSQTAGGQTAGGQTAGGQTTGGQMEDVKDNMKDNTHDIADTVHSRIPVYNCKRSPSHVPDTDAQVSHKDGITSEDRGVLKEHGSDSGKRVHRKSSVKSLQCRRDGSSDRETDGVERRRGSVSSRSSSHSRRSSVDSTTGTHSSGAVDRVAKNDSEDSLSGHDSLQNSPSSRQRKDSSSESRRTLGQSPQQKHQKTTRRDGKMSTEVSPSTTQTLDDSELENVLLEAPVPVAPPSVSSRRRRTSGSPMRPTEKVAVSERLREEGSVRRSVTTESRQKRHRDRNNASGDSDTRRSPTVKRPEGSVYNVVTVYQWNTVVSPCSVSPPPGDRPVSHTEKSELVRPRNDLAASVQSMKGETEGQYTLRQCVSLLPAGVEMGSPSSLPGPSAVKSSKVAGQATSSPRPGSERGTQKERRINLGTKAADLFAKLQQRLSANKS
ncbi:hypothetical protein NP493_77g05040 [Ridgeia piscesae]|uniref:Fibronectin type-III domain-containing protein n=1 Tax=Ridgeia piscesae TaxID=27915 RepID=A0AAD9P9B5_RIDPI|nr:hypothetical protein NP493_77g05040 [Ridgeia piscesae]